MSVVHPADLFRTVTLFGRDYWWDSDQRTDLCSVTSHCFISDRHTSLPGCVRPAPRYVLRPVR